MDVVYEVLDTLHVFIPVVAIVACVIIFVCGIRSSKSAQPPDEYLQEIKANASKNKTRNKSTKSTSPVPSSPKSDKEVEKSAKTPVIENKREKVKVEVKEVKKSKKAAKNASDEAGEETEKGTAETGDWVTVTPKRKQKENPTSNVTPTGNLQKEFPTIEETIVKRQQSDEDLPKLEENAVEEEAPVQKEKAVADVKPMVNNVVEPIQRPTTLDEAIDEDEAWSVQTGKDSRYRKTKKRGNGNAKGEPLAEDNRIKESSNFHLPSSPSSDSDQPVSNETRRRRNVRREN